MKMQRRLAIVKDEPYTVLVKCACTKRKTKSKMPCAYCKDTGRREEKRVHPSHKMTKFTTTILAPCGTPRFYSIRHCKICGKTEAVAAAGHFFSGLTEKCPEKMVVDPDEQELF